MQKSLKHLRTGNEARITRLEEVREAGGSSRGLLERVSGSPSGNGKLHDLFRVLSLKGHRNMRVAWRRGGRACLLEPVYGKPVRKDSGSD